VPVDRVCWWVSEPLARSVSQLRSTWGFTSGSNVSRPWQRAGGQQPTPETPHHVPISQYNVRILLFVASETACSMAAILEFVVMAQIVSVKNFATT